MREKTVLTFTDLEWFLMPYMQTTVEARGAFHYAKDSGNFGGKWNANDRFSSLRPEYLWSPLEVVHFDRSDRSDRNLPFHFDKTVHCPTSLHLYREFRKEVTFKGRDTLCDKSLRHIAATSRLVYTAAATRLLGLILALWYVAGTNSNQFEFVR